MGVLRFRNIVEILYVTFDIILFNVKWKKIRLAWGGKIFLFGQD